MTQQVEETVIAIPLYNAYEYLVACLDTLDKWYPENDVLLVDDQSSDIRIRQHMEAYRSLRSRKTVLVYRPRRGWFTRAANTCLETAWKELNAEWLWLLNSDTVVDQGALEEMFNCWELAKAEGHKIGMVGSHGPQPETHKRWEVAQEPGYVTGHSLLFNQDVMLENHLRFPQVDGEVRGFASNDVVHINSDRALSYQMNRLGLAPVISYWSKIGHSGGRSWLHKISDIPQAQGVGE